MALEQTADPRARPLLAMAKVDTVQNSWTNGMKRDFPRDQMPPNSAWNAVDLILNYGAPLRQRGGWANWSQDISSVSSTASYIRGGLYAVFATSGGGSTAKNMALDEDGRLYDVTATNGTSSIGAAVTIAQNPVFHGGTAATAATAVYTGLAIIPDGTGAAVPKKYNGTTLSDLNGVPPKARFASVYKDYTVLGNGSVSATYYPNRVWFSPEGDPDVAVSGAVTAWDTTDSWIDFSQPVKGFGATKNALIVFGDTQLARIRGSTPPPDEDMVVDDPLFQVGLLDPFSIIDHKESIFWAAPEGIFRTDGVVLDDLTKKGGMLRYWLDLVSPATSTWTVAGGVIRDHYVAVVMDGTTFKDCLVCDLQSYVWTRLSNVDAVAFWTGQQGLADELYWGRRNAARVCVLDSIWQKVGVSTYASDGDGDAVLPVLETPFFELGRPGLKRVKNTYLGYEVTEYAASNPIMTLGYITSPQATSYTAFGDNMVATTTYRRERRVIGKQTPGVALKMTRFNVGDLFVYDLGFELHPLEPSRRPR